MPRDRGNTVLDLTRVAAALAVFRAEQGSVPATTHRTGSRRRKSAALRSLLREAVDLQESAERLPPLRRAGENGDPRAAITRQCPYSKANVWKTFPQARPPS